MAPEIITINGSAFNFKTPNEAEYTIEDIAHSLAHICRFNGHTKRFYSVAQHSLLVSIIVPDEYALAGLLHDAAEAFIGDISTPLKQYLPDYQLIEARVERAVFERFGLEYPIPECVKIADTIALATEERDLLPPHDPWPITESIEPLAQKISPIPPDLAAASFLARFYDIRNRGAS